MIEIGSRRRDQPAPPHAVFESLTRPRRAAGRQWLALLPDEHPPAILRAEQFHLVVWGSLWPSRPDVQVHFRLDVGASGTSLAWTAFADEPEPSPSSVGHLRKRVNTLINADLRYSFGQ